MSYYYYYYYFGNHWSQHDHYIGEPMGDIGHYNEHPNTQCCQLCYTVLNDGFFLPILLYLKGEGKLAVFRSGCTLVVRILELPVQGQTIFPYYCQTL